MRTTAASAFVAVFLALALAAGAQDAPVRPIKVKVTAEQANLREKPDIGSAILQQIPEGRVLDADRKEGEWYFVFFPLEDGGVVGGWIHESLVEAAETGPAVEPPAKKPAAQPRPRERSRRPGWIGPIERPEFRSGPIPLEISFSAGLSTIAPRDLNDGTRGYADWLGASLGMDSPDAAEALNLALVAGFELSYRLSPQLVLGLGADLLGGSNGGEITLTGMGLLETLTTKPSVRAVPLKASARYYFRDSFYARGALGLYAIRARYLFRREGEGFWEQRKGRASATGLGLEAAVGGEWDLGARTVLFAEAGLRVVSVDRLTGREELTSSLGDDVVQPGTLYFFRESAGGEDAYPLVFVRSAMPSGPNVIEAREARINASGMAVRAGVRYRF
ncbi:MAG: hypothetical protein JW775_03170 [Candidatus Aminicenantes bacterium]|nr:hypothetical protein [Candidatus Aminicenantes bacterium]